VAGLPRRCASSGTRSPARPGATTNFANQEAEQGCYGNVSAYFADLLRQRRQARIDADVKLLSDGLKDAPTGPEPVEEIVALTKAVRIRCAAKSGSPDDLGCL